jgi:hypothetical protein
VYVVQAAFKCVAASVALLGTTTKLFEAESQAAWDCDLVVNAGSPSLSVTGAAGNNITWHATVWIQEVGT